MMYLIILSGEDAGWGYWYRDRETAVAVLREIQEDDPKAYIAVLNDEDESGWAPCVDEIY